jgi:hypothetical protein
MIAAQLARGFALKRQTSNPDGERDVGHGRSCIDTQGVLTCVICIGASSAAFAAEADEEDAAKPSIPNVYLDLRTSFAAIPAGTLGLGFGSSSLSTAREALAALKGTSFPRGLPAAQSIAVDLPLTVDVSDRVSLYGGVSGRTTNLGISGWSSFAIMSWSIGIQADLYQQNGESIPTVTLQLTLTQSVPTSPAPRRSIVS